MENFKANGSGPIVNADFKGFENFAKFVEFDEKNLFDQKANGFTDMGYKAKDIQLKTAQS